MYKLSEWVQLQVRQHQAFQAPTHLQSTTNGSHKVRQLLRWVCALTGTAKLARPRAYQEQCLGLLCTPAAGLEGTHLGSEEPCQGSPGTAAEAHPLLAAECCSPPAGSPWGLSLPRMGRQRPLLLQLPAAQQGAAPLKGGGHSRGGRVTQCLLVGSHAASHLTRGQDRHWLILGQAFA